MSAENKIKASSKSTIVKAGGFPLREVSRFSEFGLGRQKPQVEADGVWNPEPYEESPIIPKSKTTEAVDAGADDVWNPEPYETVLNSSLRTSGSELNKLGKADLWDPEPYEEPRETAKPEAIVETYTPNDAYDGEEILNVDPEVLGYMRGVFGAYADSGIYDRSLTTLENEGKLLRARGYTNDEILSMSHDEITGAVGVILSEFDEGGAANVLPKEASVDEAGAIEVNPDDFVRPDGSIDYAGFTQAKRSRARRVGQAALVGTEKAGRETFNYGWRHKVLSALMLGGIGIGVLAQMGALPDPVEKPVGIVGDAAGAVVSKVSDISFQSPIYFDNGENAPVQPGYKVPATFPMPAVPATPAKPEALPAGPELLAVTKTGSLPDNLTVKLVDLVGADIKPSVPLSEQPAANDLSVDIKIVPVESQKMSTFDWSVAKAFDRIGIHLLDGNNPVLNGAARWQLTTMIAHSMGLEPTQLNLVYMGDEFTGIKITPEIIGFVQAQNVVVPDSVLRTAGLVSLPASELKPAESATTVASIQTSGNTKETVGQGPPVVTESAKTNVNTEIFSFMNAESNGDGTSRITVVQDSKLESKISWIVGESNAKILTDDQGRGNVVKIESLQTGNKINYVYKRGDSEILLNSVNTPAYAAALKTAEDAKKEEEESFWEYYQMLMLLGASTAAVGAVLMKFKSTRTYGQMMLAGSVVTTPMVIGAMELSYLSNLPVYPTLGGLAAAAAALAAYALKQRGGEVKVGDDEEDLDGELVIGRTTAATY